MKGISFRLILIINLLLLILFSNFNLNAQTLKYNQVKSKGIELQIDLKSHKLYIIIGSLSSDYLICDIYIYGKYFIDFSQMEYGKIIYMKEFSKVFVQFSSYRNYYNQQDQYPFLEVFQIQIRTDDFYKIIERKNELIYFQFTGKYGSLNASLNKQFINSIEKLSIIEDNNQISLSTNKRPYRLFTIIYPFNILYSFDSNNPVINDFAHSLLFHDNITFEAGYYFKIPFLSALSFYYSNMTIFDWQSNFEITRILGLKIYITIFDFPESFFLRFSVLCGFLGVAVNSSNISQYNFCYLFSLFLGLPISPAIEYFTSISIGKYEISDFNLMFQFGIIINLL